MSERHQHESTNHRGEDLFTEMELRQRNTTFPDVMKNASSVDALMWHGSSRITKVQRVGVGLFGLVFILAGVFFAQNSYQNGFWPAYLISGVLIGAGCKLVWNSIRQNAAKKDDGKHA